MSSDQGSLSLSASFMSCRLCDIHLKKRLGGAVVPIYITACVHLQLNMHALATDMSDAQPSLMETFISNTSRFWNFCGVR